MEADRQRSTGSCHDQARASRRLTRPLLIIHPSLVPKDEWKQIVSRKDAPVITLGRRRQASDEASDPSAVYRLADSTDEESLELAVYKECGVTPPPAPVLPATEPFDAASAKYPYQWLYDLPARAVAPKFLQHAAEWITAVSGGVRVLKDQNDIRAWGYAVALVDRGPKVGRFLLIAMTTAFRSPVG